MILRNKICLRIAALCMIMAVFCLAGGTRCFAMSDILPAESQLMLEVGMSAVPEEMVEPGEATLSFTVSNISPADTLNLYLSSPDGLVFESIGQIAPGETHSFSRSHTVTEAELSAGEIVYIISHDAPLQGGGKVDYTIRAAIQRASAAPQVEFTRRFSGTAVSSGNTVSVTYRVRNTGNVALNTLQVQDSLGEFNGRIDRLEVGESRTLINRVSVSEESISSAVLSYCVDTQGDAVHSQSLSDMPIRLAEAHIDATLSAGYGAFSSDTAEVVLVLTNEGNVDYRDITITDDIHGGVIADNARVLSGSNPTEISATYPLREACDFRWRISGVSETGERIDFVTDTIMLEPVSLSEPSDLRVWAETQTPRIRRAGTVKILVHIVNDGSSPVENAVLSEATMGEIRNFAVIPAEGEILREIEFPVKEDTSLQFRVDYTDADGWMRDAQAEPISFVIASDGVLLNGVRAPLIEFTGTSIKIGGSSLFGILLVAACTVLIILIVILLIATRKAKMEKKLRIAAEKQRRKEEMGRTNPFKPIRKKK